jgi:hypothetical protein
MPTINQLVRKGRKKEIKKSTAPGRNNLYIHMAVLTQPHNGTTAKLLLNILYGTFQSIYFALINIFTSQSFTLLKHMFAFYNIILKV